jgi:toxin ParE1/3/4
MRLYRVEVSPVADMQLDEIKDFIAQRDGSVRARDRVAALLLKCYSLGTFPERGVRRDDIRPGLRTWRIEKYAMIAFEIDHVAFRVRIFGIFTGGRDADKALRRQFH